MLDNCDGFGGTYKGKPIEQYFDIAAIRFTQHIFYVWVRWSCLH